MAKSGYILHCNATRLRVSGSGSLKQTLRSLDNVNSSALANITMASSTNREVNSLANFKDQYIQLEIKTTEINEVFRLSKIRIFTKPVMTGYPQ